MTRQKPFLGVDVGKSSIKTVQLENTRKGFRLMHASIVEIGQGASEGNGQILNKLSELLIKNSSLSKQKLATLFNGRNLIIRFVTLPKMPQKELQEAIRWEAKKHTSRSLEDLVIDYIIMGESEEKDVKRFEILLVIAEREWVQKQMDEYQQYGIKLSAIDVNQLVLLNSIRVSRLSATKENLAFIDIGAGKMDIGIAKQGILRFTRTVQTGGEDITLALSKELQVDFKTAETMKQERGLLSSGDGTAQEPLDRYPQIVQEGVDRLVVEIQRSVDYYRAQFREGSIQKILLMGGGSQLPGFLDYISSYFEARVELHDPFSGILFTENFPREIKQKAPQFASGIGLALRKV